MAVKILRDDLSRLPRARERFLREAAIGRRVRHANVVSFLDLGETTVPERRAHHLVLEYVEGRTLLERVEQMGSLPDALVRQVGREVARGPAAIRAAGAVHRDVPPENVLITTDHVVELWS